MQTSLVSVEVEREEPLVVRAVVVAPLPARRNQKVGRASWQQGWREKGGEEKRLVDARRGGRKGPVTTVLPRKFARTWLRGRFHARQISRGG